MRRPVERGRAEALLQALGRRFHRPARIVITGGASLVLRGLREMTQDVDLSYSLAPEHDTSFIDALQALKYELEISVELADPGQFLPVPAGRENRLSYHGRYGAVDVFLDDPYTIAVSKLERAQDKDLNDIRLLANAGLLDFGNLGEKVREVARAPGSHPYRLELDRLLATLDLVRRGPPTT